MHLLLLPRSQIGEVTWRMVPALYIPLSECPFGSSCVPRELYNIILITWWIKTKQKQTLKLHNALFHFCVRVVRFFSVKSSEQSCWAFAKQNSQNSSIKQRINHASRPSTKSKQSLGLQLNFLTKEENFVGWLKITEQSFFRGPRPLATLITGQFTWSHRICLNQPWLRWVGTVSVGVECNSNMKSVCLSQGYGTGVYWLEKSCRSRILLNIVFIVLHGFVIEEDGSDGFECSSWSPQVRSLSTDPVQLRHLQKHVIRARTLQNLRVLKFFSAIRHFPAFQGQHKNFIKGIIHVQLGLGLCFETKTGFGSCEENVNKKQRSRQLPCEVHCR